MAEPWHTLSRRSLLSRPPWLELESHRVQLPNGTVLEDWLWVDTPEFVNVVALTPQNTFLCFRQTKYAAPGEVLALVGGYLEPGEDPHHAAVRELREETGCQAAHWTALGSYAVDGNRGCGRAHLFLATSVCRVDEPNADDLEEQTLLELTRTEIEAHLRAGAFPVLPWASALALALLHLPPNPENSP